MVVVTSGKKYIDDVSNKDYFDTFELSNFRGQFQKVHIFDFW